MERWGEGEDIHCAHLYVAMQLYACIRASHALLFIRIGNEIRAREFHPCSKTLEAIKIVIIYRYLDYILVYRDFVQHQTPMRAISVHIFRLPEQHLTLTNKRKNRKIAIRNAINVLNENCTWN